MKARDRMYNDLGKGMNSEVSPRHLFKDLGWLKPHSYGENLLTCANLHMSRFAHVSKSKFAMRSDESYVP